MKSKRALSLIFLAAVTSTAFGQQPYFNPPIIDSRTSGLNVGLTSLALPPTLDYDFMVMDVCVDAQDRPIPQDPFTCSTSRRNLRIGEDIPYSKVQMKNTAHPGYSPPQERIAGYNVPMLHGTHIRALNYRTGADILTDAEGNTRRFRHFGVVDSYDVYDSLHGYTFVYGTRDPQTRTYSHIWCGDFGQAGGGWMSYSNSHLGPAGAYGQGTFSIAGGEYSSCNPTDTAFVEWGYKSSRTFSSGRTLPVMKYVHYSSDWKAIELYYVSPVLGMVRWETWKETALTVPPPVGTPSSLCTGTGETADTYTLQSRVSRNYERGICFDQSFIKLHDRPLHPYAVPWRNNHSGPRSTVHTTTPNLVANSDFDEYTTAHWTPITNGEMSYGMATDAQDYGNRYMYLDKTGGTYTSSVAQTVRPEFVYDDSVIQGGFLIKGPPLDRQVVAEVNISWNGGSQMEKLRVYLPNNHWTPVRFNIPFNFTGKSDITLTYRIYVKGVGQFALDEVFLAIQPQSFNGQLISN